MMFIFSYNWYHKIRFRCDNFTHISCFSKFGTIFILKENSLKILTSFFSDVIAVDFLVKEMMSQVLTLFLNTGFTVFQKLPPVNNVTQIYILLVLFFGLFQ